MSKLIIPASVNKGATNEELEVFKAPAISVCGFVCLCRGVYKSFLRLCSPNQRNTRAPDVNGRPNNSALFVASHTLHYIKNIFTIIDIILQGGCRGSTVMLLAVICIFILVSKNLVRSNTHYHFREGVFYLFIFYLF